MAAVLAPSLLLVLFLVSPSAAGASRTYRLSAADQTRLDRDRKLSPSRSAAQIYEGLPKAFDARERWPTCIHGVLNQGDCGSCWAFAATECLSDRLCIFSSNGTGPQLFQNVVLSPQDILSCEDENIGCAMGSPPDLAWRHLRDYGVKTLACVPYVNGDGGSVPSCLKSGLCSNTSCSDSTRYFAQNYYHVGSFIEPSHHVQTIMEEIYKNGPVDTTFDVWSDFMEYSGGVYVHKSGSYDGLHSVKIIGWGEEAGLPYWLIQNSWGASWGPYHGFFKILRGSDECFIEAAIYAGVPRLKK
jgi:cathepsin B